MHRIDAAGFAAGNFFTDGNPSTGTPATVVDATWLNDMQENIAQLVEATGIVLSKGDYTQLLKAIVTKGLQGCYFNIGTAAGTADAITSSYTPAITTLTNGMALFVRAASANVTTTPTFTPASGIISAKTIVKGAGSSLAAGDIAGGGHWIELQYDATLDKWVQLNPATGVNAGSTGNFAGLNPYNASAILPSSDLGKLVTFYGSTAAQTLTLPAVVGVAVGKNYAIVNQASVAVTVKGNSFENISRNVTGVGQTLSNTVVLNPGDSLVLSSNGTNQWNCEGQSAPDMFPNSKAASGYQRLPNGLILQWGKVAETTQASDAFTGAVTFPIAFPTACLSVSLGMTTTNSNPDGWILVDNTSAAPSATSFNYRGGSTVTSSSSLGLFWIAIGY